MKKEDKPQFIYTELLLLLLLLLKIVWFALIHEIIYSFVLAAKLKK